MYFETRESINIVDHILDRGCDRRRNVHSLDSYAGI